MASRHEIVTAVRKRNKEPETEKIDERIKCAVCCEAMKDPVCMRQTGNSYCKDCISKWMEQKKRECRDPLTNEILTKRTFVPDFFVMYLKGSAGQKRKRVPTLDELYTRFRLPEATQSFLATKIGVTCPHDLTLLDDSDVQAIKDIPVLSKKRIIELISEVKAQKVFTHLPPAFCKTEEGLAMIVQCGCDHDAGKAVEVLHEHAGNYAVCKAFAWLTNILLVEGTWSPSKVVTESTLKILVYTCEFQHDKEYMYHLQGLLTYNLDFTPNASQARTKTLVHDLFSKQEKPAVLAKKFLKFFPVGPITNRSDARMLFLLGTAAADAFAECGGMEYIFRQLVHAVPSSLLMNASVYALESMIASPRLADRLREVVRSHAETEKVIGSLLAEVENIVEAGHGPKCSRVMKMLNLMADEEQGISAIAASRRRLSAIRDAAQKRSMQGCDDTNSIYIQVDTFVRRVFPTPDSPRHGDYVNLAEILDKPSDRAAVMDQEIMTSANDLLHSPWCRDSPTRPACTGGGPFQ